MRPLLIRGMWGLGDNIYQRAFVRAAAARGEVFLETPWPELYDDLPVRFVRGERRLRTQMKNVHRQIADRWSAPPRGALEVRVGYGHRELATGSILHAMERSLPLLGAPLVMDLPRAVLEAAPDLEDASDGRPLALVRPVTVRTEWTNTARNPLPAYVAEIARALMATHHVVLVADLQRGEEVMLEPAPPHHQAFLAGELEVRELLALTAAADVVVGGVGWIVPAAIAAKVRAFIILGGQGGHNAPEKITDPRLDLSRLGFAMPDRFCRCADMRHATCDKTISNLGQQWAAFAARTGLCSSTSPRAA